MGTKYTFIFIVILLLSGLSIPGGVHGDPGLDITLSGSDYLTITGSASCDNLTISGEATLVIENAYLQINGIVRMSEWARLFITRSTVEVKPGALDDATIVFHVKDNAMIRVTDSSTLIFRPQPTITNISYMLLEDDSDFLIKDSIFSGELPSILNQSIEISSVTAGVYLLSGYASWHMIDSDIMGRLSLDGMDLTGRWFWTSLHQRSSIYIRNCDIELLSSSASFTLLKPVSGKTSIIDTRIHGGRVDVEVAAQITLQSSSFAGKVDFKDQSDVEVTDCTFMRDVMIGSTLSFGEVTQEPETNVVIRSSVFERRLMCEGNSTTTISNSTFKDLNIRENAVVDFVDSQVADWVSIKNNSHAEIRGSQMDKFIIDDTAFLLLDAASETSMIVFYGSEKEDTDETLVLRNGDVRDISLYQNFTGRISLENTAVGNVSYYNDVNVTFELIGSSIDNLRTLRSGENVILSFIVVDSEIPELSLPSKNIITYTYHRLSVIVTLNGYDVETEVNVAGDFGGTWSGTTKAGTISFDLPYRIIKPEESIFEDYTVSTSYLALNGEEDVQLMSSKTVAFDFVDYNPPAIFGISHDILEWNMGREVIIRANCADLECGQVTSISLFYRINHGELIEVRMFKIGDGLYEATIPMQTESSTVEYYVSATDAAENSGASEAKTFDLGADNDIVYYIVLLGGLSAIFVVVSRKLVLIKRKRTYMNKFRSKN
jgi:hypothetical protein